MWVIEDSFGLEFMQGKKLDVLKRTVKYSNKKTNENTYIIKPYIKRNIICTP